MERRKTDQTRRAISLQQISIQLNVGVDGLLSSNSLNERQNMLRSSPNNFVKTGFAERV